jgi:predicted kinase
MLIIICGLPGSGKSSLARKLKTQLPAAYLNSDIVRKQIFKKPQYTPEEKKQVYDEVVNQAEKMLLKKKNVIVDATFYTKKYRQLVVGTARDTGSRYCILLCKLPEDITKSRLEMREKSQRAVSDANYEIYLKLKEKFEPIEGDFLEIDCSMPIKKQVEIASTYIGEKSGRRKNK